MPSSCVTLIDPASPATAQIAVDRGFNCFQFTVQRGGKSLEVLWSVPDFASGGGSHSGSGIPLLFPFPGRISQGIFRWESKEYRLPASDGRGNAIHGFVLNRPWRVIEQNSHRVVGEFQATRDDPSIANLWPADYLIRATYSVNNSTLSCEMRIENPDDKPLPFGLGTHPYFRIPFGGTRGNACRVSVPVTEEWELADLLPTGRRLPVPNAPALQQGMPFGEMQFDTVFTGLIQRGQQFRSVILDTESHFRVEQRLDTGFRECVVYTPGHREAICIEPYTCVPDPFGLTERGIIAGLKVLPPGGSFVATVEIAVT